MAPLVVGWGRRGHKVADCIAEGGNGTRVDRLEIAMAVNQAAGRVVPALAHLAQRGDRVYLLTGDVMDQPRALAIGVEHPGQSAGGVIAILRRELARTRRAGTEHRTGCGDLLHAPSQVVELLQPDALLWVPKRPAPPAPHTPQPPV